MKQMYIRITVAVLTFCFGLAISMTWSISQRGFTDCSAVLPAQMNNGIGFMRRP